MQNSVPSGDTIYLVFASTTSLNGSYTILTRSATTFTVATTSGLTSGTETITMYPLKNTPIEIGRNQAQIVKWPSGGVLYDQTPSTTLATLGAPTVHPNPGSGSLLISKALWQNLRVKERTTGEAAARKSTKANPRARCAGKCRKCAGLPAPRLLRGVNFVIRDEK